MITTVLPASERTATPWKNGGGVTREVAVWPPGSGLDDFDWRVSMAEVREPGAFSLFPGVERCLTVIEGGLRLTFGGGHAVSLNARSEPSIFPGDRACHGLPVGGAVVDLNVMVRRGRFRSQVERLSNARWRPIGDVALLIALEPLSVIEETRSDHRTTLGVLDGLICAFAPAPPPPTLQVGGRALGVSISAL